MKFTTFNSEVGASMQNIPCVNLSDHLAVASVDGRYLTVRRVEIWVEAFKELDNSSVVNLSRCCRKWRDITVGTPLFWTKVHFVACRHEGDCCCQVCEDFRRRGGQTAYGGSNRKWAQMLVERGYAANGLIPLDLVVEVALRSRNDPKPANQNRWMPTITQCSFARMDLSDIEDFSKWLHPYLYRIRKLEFRTVHRGVPQVFFNQSRSFPSLVELSSEYTGLNNVWIGDYDGFPLSAREITGTNYGLCEGFPVAAARLRKIDIHREWCWRPEDWRDRPFPNLTDAAVNLLDRGDMARLFAGSPTLQRACVSLGGYHNEERLWDEFPELVNSSFVQYSSREMRIPLVLKVVGMSPWYIRDHSLDSSVLLFGRRSSVSGDPIASSVELDLWWLPTSIPDRAFDLFGVFAGNTTLRVTLSTYDQSLARLEISDGSATRCISSMAHWRDRMSDLWTRIDPSQVHELTLIEGDDGFEFLLPHFAQCRFVESFNLCASPANVQRYRSAWTGCDIELIADDTGSNVV